MNRNQGLALLGFGVAGYSLYRATRRVEEAAGEMRRRGPRSDVIVPAVIAVMTVVIAVYRMNRATKKIRQAF